MRQIILDTETTGLSITDKHRLTEIGCLELIDRQLTGKQFQTYLDPEREVDKGALMITGLTNEFLKGKPKFKEIADDFLAFIEGAELIIHNAPFDVGFIDYELSLINHPWKSVTNKTKILDTLTFARKKYPGQRNSLDALCKRLNINNTNRKYHGALLDSEILAKVYLAMTAGQTTLNVFESVAAKSTNYNFAENISRNIANTSTEDHLITESVTISNNTSVSTSKFNQNSDRKIDLKIIKATDEELLEHQKYLKFLDEKSNNNCKWPKEV